jgi:FtsJ-like methyltransferase
MQRFDDATYAVMVHKLYAERVQDFLLSSDCDDDATGVSCRRHRWTVLAPNQHDSDQDDSATRSAVVASKSIEAPSPPNHHSVSTRGSSTTTHQRVTVLDTPLLTGVSQARRGYVLLLIEKGHELGQSQHDLFRRLPAMARQNISWVGRIAHSVMTKTATIRSPITDPSDNDSRKDDKAEAAVDESNIGLVIWKASLQMPHHHDAKMLLRVDCHPREILPDVCRQLQCAAAAADDRTGNRVTIDDPFEGPIAMTVSRSKCTHRLTVVAILQTSNSKRRNQGGGTKSVVSDEATTNNDATTTYYWGLEDRSIDQDAAIMQLKLNHEAADDVVVVPADAKTGRDVSSSLSPTNGTVPTVLSTTTPLSRAYYKLHQVWNDYLARDSCWTTPPMLSSPAPATAASSKSAVPTMRHGLDLGASPGGWTQVLVHCFACTKVVAVDAGIVAQRALRPVSNCGSATGDTSSTADSDTRPDAHTTVVYHVQSSMEQADLTIHEPYSVLVCDASLGWAPLLDLMVATVRRCTWTLPAVAVITLKMPFKTAGSIQRHVQDMHQKLPNFLYQMEQSMFPMAAAATSSPTTAHDAAASHDNRPQIRTRYQLVHLMANADSERTVIAIFEEASRTTDETNSDK